MGGPCRLAIAFMVTWWSAVSLPRVAAIGHTRYSMPAGWGGFDVRRLSCFFRIQSTRESTSSTHVARKFL